MDGGQNRTAASWKLRGDPDGSVQIGVLGPHLVRRNRTTRKLAFYRCWLPAWCRWPAWFRWPDEADHGGSLPDR